jgi:hypothetical protein
MCLCIPTPAPQFIGDGREASVEHHAQAGWLFWPGGWHAGQGWWADSGIEYTLEAATMRDEVGGFFTGKLFFILKGESTYCDTVHSTWRLL